MPVRHISLFFAVLLSFSHAELSPKKYKQFACYDENLSTNDLVNIGMKYDGQGDTKESRFCFQRVHFALALRQFNAGDFEQCVKKAGEAVTLGTDQKTPNPQHVALLVVCASKAGDEALAATHRLALKSLLEEMQLPVSVEKTVEVWEADEIMEKTLRAIEGDSDFYFS
eukprot:gnl/Spiro4/16446_TR8840_c0_g2_i1.p1 gnl/Spiro4/16446_TR8840_c0_g2~~gnl/Spiro4/16446_TR8840_c0_g2_i1.p1  ORF type:complete len:179 (+),score=43.43 gnl/Spiro4/16446_TR8840_c0_g2_i1:33-539(+)